MRRVVITGFGYCSPLGNADDVVIDALHTGRSGVEVIDAWRAFGHLRSLVAAPVPLRQLQAGTPAKAAEQPGSASPARMKRTAPSTTTTAYRRRALLSRRPAIPC